MKTFLTHMQEGIQRDPPFSDAETIAAALVYNKLFGLPVDAVAKTMSHHLGMRFTVQDVETFIRMGSSKALRQVIFTALDYLGITQTEIAQITGITQATVSYHIRRMAKGNGLYLWAWYTHHIMDSKREELGKTYFYKRQQYTNNNFL